MANYKERIYFDNYKVREVCIARQWYTCGDCRAYSYMLDRVSEEDYSLELLEWVARDIIEHTTEGYFDGYSDDADVVVGHVMSVLRRNCCTESYEKEEN